MRRSTKDTRQKKLAEATAASASNSPDDDLLDLPPSDAFHEKSSSGVVIDGFPDGRFVIYCTTPDAKVIQGDCQKEQYRLSPRPLSPSPKVMVADCNVDGSPHVLRTYFRASDGSPIDLTHYHYHPNNQIWQISKSLSAASNSNQHQRLPNKGNWPTLPWQGLSKLLAFLAELARLLLWPIADFRWQDKLKKRRFSIQITPSQLMHMNWDGSLILMGNVLRCVKLYADGTAIVNGRRLGPKDSGIEIPTEDLFSGTKTQPWIEWYGDMMILRMGEQYHSVMSFEKGNWYLTELHDKTTVGMFGRELSLVYQFGWNFLRRLTRILGIACVVLFVVIGILVNLPWDYLLNDKPQDEQKSESQLEYEPQKPPLP